MNAASNIGIQLTLKGAEQVKQGLKTISGSAAEMARQFDASRGVILTTAAAVATATGIMVDRVSNAAAEIERFAMLAGSTPQEFQRMAAGAKSAGMDMEKYASVMKDTQAKIGDFLQTGGGELKDFFEKIAPAIGVTADQFKNLSGPQALQLFYNSLQKANLSQKETVHWLESIADDATALEPLLRNNGAAFDALADRAAKYGAVLSDYALAASKDFKGQTDEMTLALQGAEQILAVGLMPTLTETARELLATADSAGTAQLVADGLNGVLVALAITANGVAGAFRATGLTIAAAAAQAEAFTRLDFRGAMSIRQGWKDDLARLGGDMDTFQKRLLNAGETARDVFALGRVMKENKTGTAEYQAALQALNRMKDAGTVSVAQYTAAITAADSASSALGRTEANTANAAAVAQQRIREEFKSTAEKRNEALDKARKAFGGMIPPDIEKQIREKFKEPLSDSAKAVASSAKSVQQAYQTAFESAEKQARDLVSEEKNLNSAEKSLADVMAGEHWGKWNEAQRKAIELIYQRNAATIARQKQEEADAKWASESADANANVAESAYEAANAAEAQRDAQLQANAAIGLTALEVANLEAARIDDTAAEKQRLAAIMEGIDPAIAADYRRQAQALTDLAQAKRDGAVKDAMVESAKEAADEWKRTADKIEDSLIDALMDGGKSGAEYIEGLFRSMVLRPVLQAIVSPVAGAVTSALGFGGAGGAGNALGAVNGLSSLYSIATGGLTATLGGAASSIGAAIGSSAVSAFGAGMQGSTLAAGLAGPTTAGATGAMGLGASVGAAMPWIAGGLAVASILKGMDNSGTMHTGGAGGYSAARGAFRTNDALKTGDWWNNGYDKTASAIQGAQALSKGVVDMLDASAKTFGAAVGHEMWTGFADDSSSDPAWSRLMIKDGAGNTVVNNDRKFSDGEKGQAEYAAAMAQDVRNVLKASAPDWADAMLEGLGDAPSLDQLMQAVAYFADVQAALANLGDYMPQLANLSEEAASQMMRFFGGAENMVAASSAYYQNFYTEAERAETATRQLTEALIDIGINAMPATREAYRALVEAQDITTESGRKTYASLLGLSGAFSELVPATETLAGMARQGARTTQELRDGFQTVFDDLRESISGLRGEITDALEPTLLARDFGSIGTAVAALRLPDAANGLLDYVQTAQIGVAVLGALKDETLDYYTAQKKLADEMGQSAEKLRDAATKAQRLTLDPDKALRQRLLDFDRNYTLALSTSGSVQAKYADKMAEDLPQLSQDIAARSLTRADWQIAVTKLANQSASVADALEKAVPTDLQSQANATLVLIDEKLKALDNSAALANIELVNTITNGEKNTLTELGLILDELESLNDVTMGRVLDLIGQIEPAVSAGDYQAQADIASQLAGQGLSNAQIAGAASVATGKNITEEDVARVTNTDKVLDAARAVGAVVESTYTITQALNAIESLKSAAANISMYKQIRAAGFTDADLRGEVQASNFGLQADDSWAWLRTQAGYHTGGYTGPGGKYEAAGVVHRGEVVFSQDDIARLGGVGAVEAIRTGAMAGYATGGVVGSASGPVVVPAPLVPGRVTMAPRPATPDPVQQEREAQARDQAQQQTQDLIAQLRQVNSNLTELKRSVDKSGQSNDQMNNKIFNMADTTVKLLRKFDSMGLPVVDVTPAKAAAEAA